MILLEHSNLGLRSRWCSSIFSFLRKQRGNTPLSFCYGFWYIIHFTQCWNVSYDVIEIRIIHVLDRICARFFGTFCNSGYPPNLLQFYTWRALWRCAKKVIPFWIHFGLKLHHAWIINRLWVVLVFSFECI